MTVRLRRGTQRRDSLTFFAVAAALGALIGAVVGNGIRMTVHRRFDVTSPNYGIHGALAGAVWGTLLGILASQIRLRATRGVLAATAVLVLAAALTIFDPR
jgi:hypothetical protein